MGFLQENALLSVAFFRIISSFISIPGSAREISPSRAASSKGEGLTESRSLEGSDVSSDDLEDLGVGHVGEQVVVAFVVVPRKGRRKGEERDSATENRED